MATNLRSEADRRAGFASAYRRYLGTDPNQSVADAFINSGQTLEEGTRGILNSPDFIQAQHNLAISQTQPTLASISQQQKQVTGDSQNAITQLERQKRDAPEQILSELNKRGLSRSSEATKNVSDRLAEITTNISSVQANRATRLADLASLRAQALQQQQQIETQGIFGARQQLEQELAQQAQYNQIIQSGGRNLLVDTLTGRVIADFGSSLTGGAGGGGSSAADPLISAIMASQGLNPDGTPLGTSATPQEQPQVAPQIDTTTSTSDQAQSQGSGVGGALLRLGASTIFPGQTLPTKNYGFNQFQSDINSLYTGAGNVTFGAINGISKLGSTIFGGLFGK